MYYNAKCLWIKALGLGQGWTRPSGWVDLEIHRFVLHHPKRQTVIRLAHHTMANRDKINSLARAPNINSKCGKLVFRTFPFMGMFDWEGVLTPVSQWGKSSTKSFKLQTLYTRVPSSYYQFLTINGHPMPSIPWMLSVLWTDSSQNGIQSVHHQINVWAVSSQNEMRNEKWTEQYLTMRCPV